MFHCQLSPVVTRSRRENTIELEAIAKLVERGIGLTVQRKKDKLKVNERDKEHTWRPSVGLPRRIYRHMGDVVLFALIHAPGRSWFERSSPK